MNSFLKLSSLNEDKKRLDLQIFLILIDLKNINNFLLRDKIIVVNYNDKKKLSIFFFLKIIFQYGNNISHT